MSLLLQEHPAIPYLQALFEAEDRIFFLKIHSSRTHKNKDGHDVPDIQLSPLVMRKDVDDKFIAGLENDQADGWNIYVCMNPFPASATSRTESLVEDIRNVYIDLDENGIAGLEKLKAAVGASEIPMPHSILQSSPGKFHVVWNVEDFTPKQAKAMLKALVGRFGGDPAATDLNRVLRLPGFKNLKYADKPVSELIEFHDDVPCYSRDQFRIDLDIKTDAKLTESTDINTIAELVEANAKEANSDLGIRQSYDDGYKWLLECPWVAEHTQGTREAAIILLKDGSLQFNCFHGHCAHRGWSDIRKSWETTVGHYQKFGEQRTETFTSGKKEIVVYAEPTTTLSVEPVDENSEAAIPPFDPSVINGVFKKCVDLVCRKTSLAPQYAFVIAKTVVGAKMAGKVLFENLDVEPRYYSCLIGPTGSGKGEAFRRSMKYLQPEGAMISCQIKIINSVDSGAGLKDYFFEEPNYPVLCYVDEISSLGNKSKDGRNPDIMDAIFELADCTSVSRVLTKRQGGGTKTKHDARLSMVVCGQEGGVYAKALAGRSELGSYDRLYPEYGTPQETGDLPQIHPKDAIELLQEINKLDYSGTMVMADEAKQRLDEFWNSQPASVRKKARWKKTLAVDAFMSAFGRRSKTVETEDMEIAIKIFNRQLVIRRACFTTEVPDRTGYYIGLIKRITGQMERRIAAGASPELVAKSRRDYETQTNAYRDNEIHIFSRAWQAYCNTYLTPIMIKKSNGQVYTKYIPSEE